MITLIHKKGDTSDPQNFRPIALQLVVEKIFNSFVRNKVWSFLTRDNLINTSSQKGFWPGINGVTEHLELLTYIIKHQKRQKKDIYIALLDLRKAFGEVHHSLNRFYLEHHHVPGEIIGLIMMQYTDFYLTVAAAGSSLRTCPIHVQRGLAR